MARKRKRCLLACGRLRRLHACLLARSLSDTPTPRWEIHNAFIYLKEKWIKWTNGEPLPDRITSWCCAQFLASRDAIRARPEKTWESLYNASVLEPWKGWEVLWETLLDPTRTRDLLKC